MLDAGCGGGFHLRILAALGVEAIGCDLALSAIATAPHGRSTAGDIAAPPLRTGVFDGVLCLGNTISLLADRRAQRAAIQALANLLCGGGVLVLQAEDVAVLVRQGPLLRHRTLKGGSHHARVFCQAGRRVHMLAGMVETGGETRLEESWLLPTSAGRLQVMARGLGLVPVPLPVAPPASGATTWWLALTGKATDSGR